MRLPTALQIGVFRMDMVIKAYGILALLLAAAGFVPFDQLLLLLGVGYLILNNMIVLSGTPVYT